MFKINDIVTPVDLQKVLDDKHLSPRSKAIIGESDNKAVVNQIQDGLIYVSYFNAAGDDRITQVYKPEELKLV